MSKMGLMRLIEKSGKYCKVRIDVSGEITGMLVDEDYPYKKSNNTGGRRFIGQYGEEQLMRDYNEPEPARPR